MPAAIVAAIAGILSHGTPVRSRRRRAPRLALLAGCLAAAACIRPGTVAEPAPMRPAPPHVAREFRGVWVASVSQIDWPSRAGLTTWEQQAELIAILDRSAALNMNAVVLQVRPAADALYDSPHEPWSEYLTGRQGRPPEPYWDPLHFAVEAAHARGLELHAWFNPYRARHPSARGPLATTHLGTTRPDLVKTYGNHLWMDPGEPEVLAQTLRVILDVVRRYDVDGIHLDDYFYPYPQNGSDGVEIPFPDSASYARYRSGGGSLALDDWRRNNVDTLIAQLYHGTRALKPWVKVGISPFGIWRPGHPAEVTGFDAYSRLYADARRWLREGWVDYFTPQLYWPIAQAGQSYPVLLRWWMGENVHGRHMWPGHFTSRAEGATWPQDELLEQVRLTRAAGAGGDVHFSMRALMPRPPVVRDTTCACPRADTIAVAAGLADSAARPAPPAPPRSPVADRLLAELYAEPALVPASPWLSSARPAPPRARLQTDAATGDQVVHLEPAPGASAAWWTVRVLADGAWRTRILPGAQRRAVVVPAGAPAPVRVVVTAVDRYGTESMPLDLR